VGNGVAVKVRIYISKMRSRVTLEHVAPRWFLKTR